MDRKYIENEHIVDRYLSGELTVREARDFEKYCLDHPDFLNSMPIPVRLKARLSRRPQEESETGVFQAIPSSATHAAVDATDDGFDPEEEREELRRFRRSSGVGSRALIAGLSLALIAAIVGLVAYSMHAGTLSRELKDLQDNIRTTQMQAPGRVQTYRVRPVRSKPDEATLVLGWSTPPQLLDMHVDVSQGKHNQFQVTIDKVDGGHIMKIRRIARDSNRELRFDLNSSAFGPGEYLFRIDGYTWRGQTEEVGWLRLSMQ